MASIACIADQPELIKNVILSPSENSIGIYGFKFYILGKPWVVSIDDYISIYTSLSVPIFAQQDKSQLNFWGPLMEKAWAKIKGSYDMAEGGFSETGLRALTGAPVLTFYTSRITSQALADEAWQ